MAVAIRVASPEVKPSSVAKALPFCLARTMSWSELMINRIFSIRRFGSLSAHVPELLVQISQALFQVQRRCYAFQLQPELDHCKGHFRLNPDDYRIRAPQP